MSKQLQGEARTDGKKTAVGFMMQESLLPVPEELAKFKEIEPAIVNWLMQYADREQDTRIKNQEANIKMQTAMIDFDLERLNLARSEHHTVKTSLWLAFFIAVLFIALAAILIFCGQEIAGTIFGGVALVFCVQAFLKFGRNQKQ